MSMQERYYGEKLHINTKDPASCRKVVEDFVQARSGHLPIAAMVLQTEDSAPLGHRVCGKVRALLYDIVSLWPGLTCQKRLTECCEM